MKAWRHGPTIVFVTLMYVLGVGCIWRDDLSSTPTKNDEIPERESISTDIHELSKTVATPTINRARLELERTLVLAGTESLIARGELPQPDSRGLLATLDEAYARMMADEGFPPRLLAETAWGDDAPESFNAIVVGPETTDSVVIFLHGYGGNFFLQCWQLAQAVPPSLLTICPSIGVKGDWWTAGGREKVETTFELLRAQGINSFYLAGLSNGARGAATLASHFDDDLMGIIVISGASDTTPPPGVPILAIQGVRDTMFSAGVARRYAHRAGRLGTYVEVDSGHFAFLDRVEEVQRALQTWLTRLPSSDPGL